MSLETLHSPTAGSAQIPLAYDPTLVGIRGWLILPAIGLVLLFLSSLIGLAEVFAMADEGVLALGVGLLIQVPLVVFIGYVAKMFFTKRRAAPTLYITLQWGMIALAAAMLFSGLDDDPALQREIVASILAATTWTLYFLRSRRVKQTFVK